MNIVEEPILGMQNDGNHFCANLAITEIVWRVVGGPNAIVIINTPYHFGSEEPQPVMQEMEQRFGEIESCYVALLADDVTDATVIVKEFRKLPPNKASD